MKCYLCKKEVNKSVRHFTVAHNGREKDSFRDICLACYPKQMESEGYFLVGKTWMRKKANEIGSQT